MLIFLAKLRKFETEQAFLLECYHLRLQFENANEKTLEVLRESYIQNIENKFRVLTPKITDYKTQGNYSDVIASKYTVIAEILKMTTKQEVNARKYKALLTKKIQIEETNI